ncbi:hypothetical protein QN277_027393 [Acacia crassicarpa]|uniref:Uncharacterized protein n=1 Tax=Acacia crassicarpa TaxID=499986 RepID=A0AAE1J9W7_9FABA|nr:hypothetical protein QN277_027393 [Acacia crassicarpa]
MLLGTLEEACNNPNGENAESGPGANVSSGFGGLGLEGMVVVSEPVGMGDTPPLEGKSGAISGGSSWSEHTKDRGGSANAASEE